MWIRLLLFTSILYVSPALASSCQTLYQQSTRCINGCYVQTTVFINDPAGTACYKNQGGTVACDCGGYVYTASPAGNCDETRRVCDWWISARKLLRSYDLRKIMIAQVYVLDCDGNPRRLLVGGGRS